MPPPNSNTADGPLSELFARSKQAFPEKWRQDCWYLTMVAALIGSGQSEKVGDLYQYVLETDKLDTPEVRKRFVRRLREAMIKCIILNGIPRVMVAFHSLVAVEREEDRDPSFTRQGWLPDEENERRALQTHHEIYRGNQGKLHATMSGHPDILWISTNISYGLFLSDHNILDIAESELAIMPAIMCQDLKGPTHWHLRGCLRVGLTREEVQAVQNVVEGVVAYAGGKLDQIGTVWDVASDEHTP